MGNPIKKSLYRVSEEVLEKLAFMFSFPEEDRDSCDFDAAVAASVSFSGPFNGNLVMVVSNEILPELTGNMLGIDNNEDTTSEQHHDALKELINVICGNLLPAIAGKQSVFNVNAPIILSKDKASIINADDSPKPISVARLAIEDEPCDILLFIEGDIPPEAIAAESEDSGN